MGGPIVEAEFPPRLQAWGSLEQGRTFAAEPVLDMLADQDVEQGPAERWGHGRRLVLAAGLAFSNKI